jgi:hypothetical protein
MKIKVQTINTLYTIEEVSNRLYIQGHPEFCPVFTACEYITIGFKMIFKPFGSETIYTSPVKTVDFEVSEPEVLNSEG